MFDTTNRDEIDYSDFPGKPLAEKVLAALKEKGLEFEIEMYCDTEGQPFITLGSDKTKYFINVCEDDFMDIGEPMKDARSKEDAWKAQYDMVFGSDKVVEIVAKMVELCSKN